MKLFVILFLSVFSEAQFQDVGQTFKYAGPNCFGVSLYGAGLYPHVRAVGHDEFSEFIKQHCQPVSQPQTADLGVYSSPQGMLVHAVAYYTTGLVYEKQGVDYRGATPIQILSFESMNYRVEATPLCRRFGDETCFNQVSWLRCQKRSPSSKLLLEFEEILENVLKGKTYPRFNQLYGLLGQIKREGLLSPAQIKSLELQLEFIF